MTKILIIISCCLLFFPTTVAQRPATRFDPDGSFWIIGKVPHDFSDFSGINLNAKHLRRLPTAGVQLMNGKTFRFKTLSVSRQRLSFTTVALNGESYSFSGAFLRGGVFAEINLDDKTAVLEGVLTRNRRGKKVAEARLKFQYFGGT